MDGLPILETARLRLRPLSANDADDLFALYRDAETMRYMPSPPHHEVGETRAAIVMWMLGDNAYWAITRHADPTVIGYIGYLGNTRVPGMGYALRRDWWGQGIVVEAARPVLAHGFEQLGHDRVELWIDERNLASRRVAEKLDFGPKGRLHLRYNHESAQHTMLVYGLRVAAWRGAASGPTRPRTPRLEPVLAVHNIAATTAYYRDKLGFHIDFVYAGRHAGVSRSDWSCEGVVLQLTQVPDDQPLVTASYLYIHTDHRLDELYAAYVAAGVEIVDSPQNEPWGMREFCIRDLNGYLLRFGTPAAAPEEVDDGQ